MRFFSLIWFAVLFFVSSCRKAESPVGSFFEPSTPVGFPEMVYPEDNAYSYDRWFLGKQLFFDKRLSRNNDLSCATCHQPGRAFADHLPFSFGDNNALGTTNAPTLANVGYQPYYNFNGGVATLEMQILVPIQEHNEFNTNILEILSKLSNKFFDFIVFLINEIIVFAS